MMNKIVNKHSNNDQGFIHLILILMVLVVLGIGGYLVYQNYLSRSVVPTVTETITTTPQSREQVEQGIPAGKVNITNTGFVPETITIKVGQTITFVNKSAQPHHIAAAPFPSHNSLPEFDSGEDSLNTNDSYTFTFEKAGTFNYQDDLNPLKFQGTVVVE